MSRPGRRPLSPVREGGFTLTEVCVVIAVLGIVFSLTVVGTQRLVLSNRLVGARNTLIADLHYARMLATTERRNVQVAFASGGYSVSRVSPAETVLSRSCPQGVTCSSTATTTFYAWGLAVPATITLAGPNGSKVLRLAANGHVARD